MVGLERHVRIYGDGFRPACRRQMDDESCHGEYTRIERPRLLEFSWNPSWQGDNTESLVRFDLSEKDGVTTVRVTHCGLTPVARDAHKGWPQVLGWLKAYVE